MSDQVPFNADHIIATAPVTAAPVYVQATAPAPANGMGVTGLVLGIVGACLMLVPLLGGLLGILATVFSGIGLSNALKGKATNKGMAVAGLVLGIITILFYPLVFGIAASVPVTP